MQCVNHDDARDASSPPLTLDVVMNVIKTDSTRSIRRTNMLTEALSDASCINRSFVERPETQERTSAESCGIDFQGARKFFKEATKPCYIDSTEKALKAMLDSLPQSIPSREEDLRLLILLPCCLYGPESTAYSEDIVIALSKRIAELNEESMIILGTWMTHVSSYYFKRCVSFFKECVNRQLIKRNIMDTSELSKIASATESCVKALDMMHEINKMCRSKPIPYQTFYIDSLDDKVSVKGDFRGKLQDIKEEKRQNFRFCKYPFLYNSPSKQALLREQCQQLMKKCGNLSLNQKPLVVERDGMLKTARDGLPQDKDYLRKQLTVKFKGELNYCGDGGRQEFFRMLITELLGENFGACYYKDTNTQWFCVKADAEASNLDDIRFLGLICGLALYNGAILLLQFPLALYKKLLNKPVTLEDLRELEPSYYQSCKSVLECPPDHVEKLELNFGIPAQLCPNGENITVTRENRHDFVAKVMDYCFNTSVKKEYESFREGFYTAIPEEFLHSFQPKELQRVLIGKEEYDFEALQKVVQYASDYSKDHDTIRMFWEVLIQLDDQDQKNFFEWLTGTSRIPAYGMSQMEMKIHPRKEETDENPNQMLPHAMTCFNYLILPRYTNKDVMKQMLLAASRSSPEFSMEVDHDQLGKIWAHLTVNKALRFELTFHRRPEVDQVEVQCLMEDMTYVASRIVSINLGKTGEHPLVTLQSAKLEYGPRMQSNIKAEGHFNQENGTQSFLKVTINRPQLKDAGEYQCKVFYVDRFGDLRDETVRASLDSNFYDVTLHLTTELSTLKSRLDDQENKIQSCTTEYARSSRDLSSLKKKLEEQDGQLQELRNRAVQIAERDDISNRDISSLKTKLADQDKQLRELNDRLEKNTERDNRRSAFLATVNDQDHKYEQSKTAQYPDVKLNVGSNYNPDTGIYTAPSHGLYVFHILGHAKRNNELSLVIQVNGAIISEMFTRDKDYNTQGSMSVVSELWKGDKVQVSVRFVTNNTLSMKKFPYTSFCGYLIHTM